MKTIVLSGIALFSGGTLSIYKDMLNSIRNEKLNEKYNIVCFVYKKELFKEFSDLATFIELPKARKNYFYRLYYEYIYFKKFSINNNIFVWISVHDLTPRVKADKLFTYCHNPMMFYKVTKSEFKYSKKLFLFSLFYKYIYKINIKNNTNVIVQQNWIRSEFEKKFKIDNVLVAKPQNLLEQKVVDTSYDNKDYIFLFASQATFFKNFEIILEAAKILVDNGINNFIVELTINGFENKYSRDLLKKYNGIKNIKWLGFLKREDLYEHYSKSNCLIFPSKLETWGLPVSEYKATGKPIVLADLPYAHETIGSYDKVAFFDCDNGKELADIMKCLILGKKILKKVKSEDIKEPYVSNWKSFWDFILK